MGMDFQPVALAAAWTGRYLRTGKKPEWVLAKQSMAKRRIMRGDYLGCRVHRNEKETYERREERRGKEFNNQTDRPFEGFPFDSVDHRGQRTFSLGRANETFARSPFYETFYSVSQDPVKSRYLTVKTSSNDASQGGRVRSGRRVPMKENHEAK